MKLESFKKDIRREFSRSISRFLSITVIVCLGVGFFAGMKATSPTMIRSAQEYFNQHDMMDIELMNLLGFTADDVKAVEQTEGVKNVTPAYSVDALVRTPGRDAAVAAAILTLPKEGDANQVDLIEGRMPEKGGECVICAKDIDEMEYHVGDVIHLEEKTDGTEMNTVLRTLSYTVVGLVKSPLYFSYTFGSTSVGDGEIYAYMYVPASEFLYTDYTEMYVNLDIDYDTVTLYDDEYEAILSDAVDRLNALGKARQNDRLTEIHAKMDKEYEDGKKEAESQLAAAQAELDSANQELQQAQSEIASGRAEYNSNLATYEAEMAAAQAEIEASQQKITEGKQLVSTAQQLYDVGQTVLNNPNDTATLLSAATSIEQILSDWQNSSSQSGNSQTQSSENNELTTLAESTLASAYTALASGDSATIQAQMDSYQTQINDYQAQITEGEEELAAAQVELAESKAKYEAEFAAARQELDDAQTEYDAGVQQYTASEAEYNTAKADTERQLSDAAAQIRSAKKDMGGISYEKWYVLDRDDAVTNYAGIHNDADRIDALSILFPAFFLLVAALVCVTTMTRMVEEQRGQMGTYKALGYSEKQILSKYLLYSLSASVIGGVIGQILCIQIFPRVIIKAYEILYSFPKTIIVVPWLMAAVALVVGILCTVFVTFICCRKETRSVAASLMRPKAPKAGKQIALERTNLWQRLGFSAKITIRNLFRYKIRVLMTIVGITGCMALIVAGFGLKDSISPVIDLQFAKIDHFDFFINAYESVKKSDVDACEEKMMQAKDAHLKQVLFTYQEDLYTKNSTGTKEVRESCYLFVPENLEEFENFISLNDDSTGKPLTLTDDGVVISAKMAKKLGLSVGDTFNCILDDVDYPVKVSAIAENYIDHYVYMSPKAYEATLGKALTFNTIVGTTDDGIVDVKALLAIDDNFLDVESIEDIREYMADGFESMDMVILVLILSASALAIVVLYNLTNINISERIREIATVKVLGFTQRESNLYIFRENIIMTAIGLILGCVSGYGLAQVIINMVEVDSVTFSRVIQPRAYLLSSLITIAITCLVVVLMQQKIKRIDMVEALKSIE